MRRGMGLAAILLVAACSAPAPSPSVAAVVVASPSASATRSPRPTPTPIPTLLDGEAWLAVQTQTAAGYGVHLVRPDGSGLHRWPAPVPGRHEHPDWSPDGRRILLNTVMPGDNEDLWVGNVDGSETSMLLDCVAPCVWVDEAAWSPDGSRIAFQRLVDDEGRSVSTLELLDVATGATSVVLTMPSQEVVLQPRWAPDGRRIVVEVLRLDDVGEPISGAIGIVDLDAATPAVELITDADFSNSPDWSSDGSLVLWSRPGPDGGSDVWVAAPDGRDARPVTELAAEGGGADQPAFAPDGESIVFVWTPAGGGRARIGQVALDGSGLASATGDLTLDGFHPRLRPVD